MATILVADDEQLIRWSLSERLQSDGLRVIEAATGQEAIDKVHEGVDLVLLDFKLPDIDGVTVLRQIKDHDPDVVVIDLEKSRIKLFPAIRALYDLATLNRHAKHWSKSRRLYFFKQYYGIDRLGLWHKLMCRLIVRRSTRRKDRRQLSLA